MTNQDVPFTQCPTFTPAESEHYYRPAVFPEVTIPNWVIDMCRASGSVPYGWHIVTVTPTARCGSFSYNAKHDTVICFAMPESCVDRGVFWAVCDAVRHWHKEKRATAITASAARAFIRHFSAVENFVSDVEHPDGVSFGFGTVGWETEQIIKAKIAEAIA